MKHVSIWIWIPETNGSNSRVKIVIEISILFILESFVFICNLALFEMYVDCRTLYFNLRYEASANTKINITYERYLQGICVWDFLLNREFNLGTETSYLQPMTGNYIYQGLNNYIIIVTYTFTNIDVTA